MYDNTRAAYRILNPYGFFSTNDTLYAENEEIYFDGEPNEQMEPLNELAKTRLVNHIEKLDAAAKATAEKLGRPFVGRPRGFDGQLEIAGAVQRQQMSIMGTRNKVGGTEKIDGEDVPETGVSYPMPVKRGRGRPPKSASKVA